MVSKIIILLIIPALGINILIPVVVFADSTDTPTITLTPAPTPFESYSQKKHSLFSDSNLSNSSAFSALNQATAPVSTLVNGLMQLLKRSNYSGINIDPTNKSLRGSTDATSQKIFNGINSPKGDLSGQGALLGIKVVLVFILRIFLTILDVVSQIIGGILGLFT